MTEDNITTNVQLENGNPAFAKPVLYEVPTYLAESPIETLNRKTKRKKAMALRFNKVLANTRESDHYFTPRDFYQKLNEEFGFTFDPCPLRCETFNGLEIDWKGVIYVNPPYSHIEVWIEKGINEIRNGNAEKVVYLIPLRTDSWYWHNKILAFSEEVRLVRGRLRFGENKDLAPFGVALIVFDKNLSGNAKLKSYEK